MATKPMQLCWDCKNACCGCSWSLTGKPIPGWTATKVTNKDGLQTYAITDCPEFVRDAYSGGTSRHPPLTEAERRARAARYAKNKYRRQTGGAGG